MTMPPTTGYSLGDIVLVSFPFTDQSATKRRPAVIVSAERYNRERPDLIIMAVTSEARPAGAFGEVRVKNRQVAGLIKPSVSLARLSKLPKPDAKQGTVFGHGAHRFVPIHHLSCTPGNVR